MTVLVVDTLRIVVELAAREDRRTALKLVLVSRLVASWIDIVLYETVRLHRPRTSDNFLRTIETSRTKPPAFFATHVKSLCILFDMAPEQVVRIASICSGIQNITTWFLPAPCCAAAPCHPVPLSCFMSGLRPRKVAAWHGILCSPDPHVALPFFSHVTHLTVVNIWEEWSTWPWPAPALRALTHLSLDFTFGSRVLEPAELHCVAGAARALLRRCERLRVCALRIDQPERAASVAALAHLLRPAADPRIVFYRHRDPFQIREAHSAAEARVWAALEAAVAQQAAGTGGAQLVPTISHL
ncbi:hypothetical protein GGX14DRAFT_570706 [Mycena pura]|uniref:Uncharacterized protein n=1 Tax=Mycena pura TaxID=153505 RepID=A0AAD6V8D5_9AGAR|nr:hypothetical protein GGX14DRAFT_570706 [Mycena pura]